ncbi:hypothetical protein LIER_17623 [Lithospermum erythrorhizon]|uniref:Uncharacterized protein n=1 Tax=Lithospermum erythrorhizon TaxID=34254 RepID=A0AAV3QCN5_LITER
MLPGLHQVDKGTNRGGHHISTVRGIQRPECVHFGDIGEPSSSGWIVKWAIDLSEFDMRYKSLTSIKAQALADFMVECTHELDEGAPNQVDAADQRVWLLYIDGASNPGGSAAQLGLVGGKRVVVVDKTARYKVKVAAHYNKRVQARQFLVGDLVLRARRASAHGKPGKLESPCEGPYLVRRVVGPVSYELETLEGRQVPRSWNACHLMKYYV